MTMRRIAVLAGVALAAMAFAGCATATIEDAVPAGALAQSSVPADTAAGATDPVPTGTYPNLNAQPAAAAPQISAQEKAEQTSSLRATRDQLMREGQGQDLGDNGEALRRLADSHGDEALKQIEGE